MVGVGFVDGLLEVADVALFEWELVIVLEVVVPDIYMPGGDGFCVGVGFGFAIH